MTWTRRHPAGTLVLEQGTVNLSASGNQLRLANDNSSGSKGVLSVLGGTFDLGGNAIYINYAGTGANNAGTLNLSGGALTTAAIQFGNGGTYSSGSTASLNVSGGTLYLGPGGISQSNLGTLMVSTVLSGGIIAATADWSSPTAMMLTTTNGNITFQAADAGARCLGHIAVGRSVRRGWDGQDGFGHIDSQRNEYLQRKRLEQCRHIGSNNGQQWRGDIQRGRAEPH